MKLHLPSLFCCLIALTLYSCADNSASPIRNVRFDPELLNRAQLTAGNTTTNFTFTHDKLTKNLGTVYTKQVVTIFDKNLSVTAQQELLKGLGFVKAIGKPFTSGDELMHTLDLVDGLNPVQVQQAIVLLQELPQVTYAAPLFLSGAGNQLTGIGNELTVQLKNKDQVQELKSFLALKNASLVKALDEQTFLVKVNKNSKGNALELANLLNKQGGFGQSQPNFLKVSL